ncbi:hypothetical protein IFR05_002934 [Cadophora sp. M221]|nr:hypothetical protein IFR05_002934 [Cadophora sp. M221]
MDISKSIFNTIQAGLAVSQKLFELGEKSGPAGAGATQWAIEISLLNSTLSQIQSAVTKGEAGRYAIGAVAIIQKILERCEQIYGELEIISNRVMIGKGGKEDLAATFRYEFEKAEVKIMKGITEACNITLHLMQHNLSMAKDATRRRHSSFGMYTEDQQQGLIIQALQTSRQTTILALESLENGNSTLHSQPSNRSTNKLRKLKPLNKRTEMRDSNIQKERASDWVKNLVRLERNNSHISLEFLPEERDDNERFLGGKGNSENRTVREGVGELQGDGPDDLVRGSERMEYTRGWPSA